jgi:hypothetical protein
LRLKSQIADVFSWSFALVEAMNLLRTLAQFSGTYLVAGESPFATLFSPVGVIDEISARV